MSEPEAICNVNLRTGVIGDDYTLYDDGGVLNYYDRNTYSENNDVWLTVQNLSEYIKYRLLDECPEHLKEKAKKLLYPETDKSTEA